MVCEGVGIIQLASIGHGKRWHYRQTGTSNTFWDYFQIILRLFLRAARVSFSGQCCGVSLPLSAGQKRVPSRVTGDVKKVHYRRHARTCVMCDLCQMARHARSSPAAQSAQFCFGCQWVACCSQSQRRLCRSREARERKGGLPQAKLQSMRSHRAEREKFFHVSEVWRDFDEAEQNSQVEQWGYIIFRSTRLLSQTGHFLPALGL